MKTRNRLLVATTLIVLAACTQKQADQAADAQTPAEPKAPVAATRAAPSADRDALVRHMHLHAVHLQKLNMALAAGDLEAAETPAYWLSRHETIPGLPNGWALFIAGMRAEGRVIEEATDLTTARAAAGRLAENCRGCHTANGVDVDLSAYTGG